MRIHMSRRLVPVGALLFFSVVSAAAQTQQEVMKAEQTRLEARRKADSATLARLSSDDLLIVGPSGQLIDKKGASALSAVPNISQRDGKTEMFGDVAVVTGVQAGVGASGDQAQRFTRIWQRRNGEWQQVFGQVTVIDASQPSPGTTLKQVQQTVWPKGSNADQTVVIDTLRRLDEAYAKKDAATYGRLTSGKYARIGPGGAAVSREDFLKEVAGTPDLKRDVPNLSEFRVRVYGPVAVVTWLNKSVNGSSTGTRRSRVFVKEDASWKQLVNHDTRVVMP
jgi:hypothetical protein